MNCLYCDTFAFVVLLIFMITEQQEECADGLCCCATYFETWVCCGQSDDYELHYTLADTEAEVAHLYDGLSRTNSTACVKYDQSWWLFSLKCDRKWPASLWRSSWQLHQKFKLLHMKDSETTQINFIKDGAHISRLVNCSHFAEVGCRSHCCHLTMLASKLGVKASPGEMGEPVT